MRRNDQVWEMKKIEPKAEVEQLLNALYPFAEEMLRTCGEFNPFGGYVDADGAVVHASIDELESKESGADRCKRLVDGLRESVVPNGARACGFAVNVWLPDGMNADKQEAIRIFLEHKDGYCADVFYCYALDEKNEIAITKNYAQQGVPVFFKQRGSG